MKVKTFDLVTGEPIECELDGLTGWSGMFYLRTPEGKKIARHPDRCSYDKEEFAKWMDETYAFAVEAMKRSKEQR